MDTVYENGFVPSGESECNCGYSDITTPLVVSKTKLKYGFFEISAKMAKAQLLSAFWLQGNSGEINVFETVPQSMYGSNGVSNSNNYHCFNAVATAASTEDNRMEIPGFDPSTAFNTYGIDWSSAGVKFYINGALVRTLSTNQIAKSGCLDQSMSVIFSMETLESEGVPSNFGTKTTQLAYFRYYTKDTSISAVSAAGAKSCEDLGWQPVVNGVCGESDEGLGPNGVNSCYLQASFQAAESTCTAAGARLCTAAELSSKVTVGTGCNAGASWGAGAACTASCACVVVRAALRSSFMCARLSCHIHTKYCAPLCTSWTCSCGGPSTYSRSVASMHCSSVQHELEGSCTETSQNGSKQVDLYRDHQ